MLLLPMIDFVLGGWFKVGLSRDLFMVKQLCGQFQSQGLRVLVVCAWVKAKRFRVWLGPKSQTLDPQKAVSLVRVQRIATHEL